MVLEFLKITKVNFHGGIMKAKMLINTLLVASMLIFIQSCGNISSIDQSTNIEAQKHSRGFNSGDNISIYSTSASQYISVQNDNSLIANSSELNIWSTFTIENTTNGNLIFQSLTNGKYITAINSNDTLFLTDTPSEFTLYDRGDSTYSIYSVTTNTHLNVNPGESNVVKAQWNDNSGGWQQMQIIPAESTTNNKIIGVDLSEALYAQNKGVIYKDENGNAKDVFEIFYDNGYTWVRVRVNVEPQSNDYAMFTDLEYAKTVGQKAKNLGFKLLVDFHYSHWWADPENQWTPSSWLTTSNTTLSTSVYNWTKNAVSEFIDTGIEPDMIQIGNEIDHGMLWDLGNISDDNSNWTNVARFINSGINAVSDAGSNAEIMLHTATGGDWSFTSWWIESFISAGGQWEDVDAFGFSYYPMWHGSSSDLSNNLNNLQNAYPEKDLYIVETAYYWDNNQLDYSEDQVPYPQNEQGQYDFLQNVKSVVNEITNVKGVFYWGAAWAKTDMWLNASGWSDDDASRRSLFDDDGAVTLGLRGLID